MVCMLLSVLVCVIHRCGRMCIEKILEVSDFIQYTIWGRGMIA